jgi:hypothetical protein
MKKYLGNVSKDTKFISNVFSDWSILKPFSVTKVFGGLWFQDGSFILYDQQVAHLNGCLECLRS